ncbi:MAG: sulfatase-like hydrolase/transferase [Bacteroidota bacterium]
MRLSLLLACLFSLSLFGQGDRPNILLIIADDLGVDRLNGYHASGLLATTPTLDSLRGVGLTFTNAFAAPKCTPTRAAIMSGKYGIKTGVLGTPGDLSLSHTSVFKELATQTDDAYADALIGKWHLSQPASPQAPLDHGADYYMGFLGASPESYFAWSKTENGTTSESTEYATSTFTDAAIDWVGDQGEDPWFLWLAHAAPHAPFHVPPAGTYSISPTNGRVRQYVAMVENLDFEINRLLQSLTPAVRENTLVIFVGDNGTPGNVMQDYPAGHGKSTLYQGGVRVPMIITGKGVTRQGEREEALVHVADLHATILAAAGAELPGGLFNSLSFLPLLSDASPSTPTRQYNYSELNDAGNTGFTIREQRYKLIEFADGAQEFYDLQLDSFEVNNLLPAGLTTEQTSILANLEAEAAVIRSGWSCRDFIQNGEESGIDCGTDACGACTTSTLENTVGIGVKAYPNPSTGRLTVEVVETTITQLSVFDIQGKLLGHYPGRNSNTLSLDLTHLGQQLLHLRIATEQGAVCRKIVLRE